MRKIRTEQTASDSHWFVIDGQDCFLPWDWRTKVDMQSMTYIIPYGDDRGEWEVSPLPTLNDLVQQGHKVEEGVPYEKHDVDFPDSFRRLTPQKAFEVMLEFNAEGFPVTMGAIMHNYAAWCQGWKSGYRGEGFHLFTPCGGNPLSFRATTLHPSCDDWQTTYMC